MQQFDLDDAQKHLGELIEAALKGEEIIISKDNTRLVQLVAVKPDSPKRVFGSVSGLVEIAPDFDELPDDFQAYIPQSKIALWESAPPLDLSRDGALSYNLAAQS